MKIESTLAGIAEAVFSATEPETARIRFIQHMEKSRVNQADKNKMIAVVKELKTLHDIQRYTANALLKYEGMGL